MGFSAPDFSLPDPQGRLWTIDTVRGQNGLLVMFICNHCPFVRAVTGRIVRDARELSDSGIGSVAIMPNDVFKFPEDAPENMQAFAARHGFSFPYLYDETQEVARAYGAVCTPDFYGFDADLKLRYRGRLDASGRKPAPDDAPRELLEAMKSIALGGKGPGEQIPSIGCSIKWR